MSADQYASFEQLFVHERAGTDYRILIQDREAGCVIMAPHGGRIEPATSEIARCISGDDYSLYLFEGLRKRPHGDLHVTSHKYDEPQAVAIAEKCDCVVAIHGRQNRDDPCTVWVGGLDVQTGGRICAELNEAHFAAAVADGKLAAMHPNNICNRARTSRGVQLEVPKSLRDECLSDSKVLKAFSQAVRMALPTPQE